MWIPFVRDEVSVVTHFLGRLLVGVAVAMLLPLATAVVFAEWNPALDYLVGFGATLLVATLLVVTRRETFSISGRQALLVSACAWIAASLLGAVPFVLSGHFGSFLDAAFESASGFTTSGLSLAQNLDHMAHGHNMWRHLTHLIGGQGIIVAAVSLAVGLKGGAFSLYLAEGRDEKILPNVIHTARFIWFVTATWIIAGTVALLVWAVWSGMSFDRGLLHAFWLTIAAYDTGGFAPQSMSALFYHSPMVEGLTVVLMLAGTFNFNLHAEIWRGDRIEVFRDIEARTIAINMVVLTAFVAAGVGATRAFSGPLEAVRKGAYHIVSANSGTGHQTLYVDQWADFGAAGFVAIILAMAFGGMVSSTAGGIKALRIGIMLKAMVLETRRLLSPATAQVRTKYHHVTERELTPQLVAAALMTFALYVVTYLTGGLIGAAYGYPMELALFESVSATANVGLTSGITAPTMPVGMKLLYMVQMLAGRLEFFTLLALIAAIVSSLLPRRSRA